MAQVHGTADLPGGLTLLDVVDDGLENVTGEGKPKRLQKAIERHTPMAERRIGSA